MMPKQEIFMNIANKLGVDPSLPEKENFVVQVIKQIAENLKFDNGELVFGGGTSLSCAYKAIQRFSEDIDLRFIPRPNSTSEIRKTITDFVRNMPGFELKNDPESDSSKIVFHIDYSKNPEFTGRESLREHIKLEIYFADKVNFEPELRSIISLYNESENLPAETKMKCVSLLDTAVDKISSLLWRLDSEKYHPSDMRHLHDLASLCCMIKIDDNFKAVVRDVYENDSARRTKSDKSFDSAVRDTLMLLSANKKKYAADYERFVSEMSYAENPISFESALENFEQLLKEIN